MAKPNKKSGSKVSLESKINLATAIINLTAAIILLITALR